MVSRTLARAPKVIVLDVDDTLYLERCYVRSGFRAVGDHIRDTTGVEGFAATAWRLFEQGERGSIFNQVAARLGVPAAETDVAAWVAVYRQHAPAIELLPDARAMVESCQRNGIAMAVITDGPPVSQRAKLRALNLPSAVGPVIVTGEHGETWAKPAESAFSFIESVTTLAPDVHVYVGDNPEKDFIAPRARGWLTYRVRRPGSLHEALRSRDDVDTEAESLEPIVHQLLSNRGAS